MLETSDVNIRTWIALLLAVTLAASGARGAEGRYQPIELGEKDREILEVVDGMDQLFDRRGYVLHAEEPVELLERVCGAVLEGEDGRPHMDFTFRIIRDPLPNAFAMPNGSIYFTTGMLGALEDEAQVAAICAHEANHVLGHHTFITQKSNRKKTAGYIAGSMLLGAATAQVGGIGGALLQEATGIGLQVLYVASVLGYSRDLEEEADRRAVSMVVDAGYDPRAMVEIFEILGEDYEGLLIEQKTFWLNHPKLQDRITYTNDILLSEYADPVALDSLGRHRERFLDATEELARRNIALQIDSGYPRTAVHMARTLVERHGESPENLVILGDAWRALGGRTLEPPPVDTTKQAKKERRRQRVTLTRREREAAALRSFGGAGAWEMNRYDAHEAYRKALELDERTAEAWRGLGYLYEKDGAREKALEAFSAYLQLAPEAPDRYVIQRHMAALRASEPPSAAAHVPEEAHR